MRITKEKLRVVIVIIILFFILFLNKFLFPQTKNFLFSVFSPIQKISWHIGKLDDKITSFKEIQKENKSLREENLKLAHKVVEIELLEEENSELRKALNIPLREKHRLIMADIISREMDDCFLLDKGQNQGVKKGLPVITSANVLIGRIGEVFPDYSQVVLITQRDFKFSANIASDEKLIAGLCYGKGNLNLIMEFIPKEERFNKGDIVSSSALGGIFPQGLLIGEIDKIDNADTKAFQKAIIKPYFTQINLTKLFIVN